MPEQNEFSIEKWDHRHWAVFDGSDLVCVTVYKKGAVEVKKRLEQRASEQHRIDPQSDSRSWQSPISLSTPNEFLSTELITLTKEAF